MTFESHTVVVLDSIVERVTLQLIGEINTRDFLREQSVPDISWRNEGGAQVGVIADICGLRFTEDLAIEESGFKNSDAEVAVVLDGDCTSVGVASRSSNGRGSKGSKGQERKFEEHDEDWIF